MSPTIAERITLLEAKAAVCEKQSADVEQRLRRIEKAIHYGIGGLCVLNIILKLV